MRFDVEVGGRRREVIVTREGGGLAVEVDGHACHVDAMRIDGLTLSLIVSGLWPKGDTSQTGAGSTMRARVHEVVVVRDGPAGALTVRIGPAAVPVALNGRRRRKIEAGTSGGSLRVVAPMPGKIVRVLVQPGEAVRARQPLVVVEAMKMENELRAEANARVARIHVSEGASVDAGALLVVLE